MSWCCVLKDRKVWQSIYILDMPQEWQFTLSGIVDEIQTRQVRVCNYWIVIQSSLFFTGINSQLKNKFIRFSCLSSHSGDMILTVKHNVDTFCLVAINNNLSSQYHCGILHRWLSLCYKTWDLQALKYSKGKDKKKEQKSKQRKEQAVWKKCTGFNSVCDHNHQSPWSTVSWHAALTFTYIICHHFTINHRFMTLVNARALKVFSPSSLCHPVLSLTPFFQGVSLHHHHNVIPSSPPPLLFCWLGV